MSAARHTPGPWAFEGFDATTHNGVEHHDFGYVSVTDRSGEWQSICSVQGSNPIVSGLSREECEANALLIAAAPDMLAALKSLFENPLFELGAPKFDGRPSGKAKAGALAAWDVLVESARASIAKAKGRS